MLAIQRCEGKQIALIHPDPNQKDESIVWVSSQNETIMAAVDEVVATYTVALISPRWHRRPEGTTGFDHRHKDAGLFEVKCLLPLSNRERSVAVADASSNVAQSGQQEFAFALVS